MTTILDSFYNLSQLPIKPLDNLLVICWSKHHIPQEFPWPGDRNAHFSFDCAWHALNFVVSSNRHQHLGCPLWALLECTIPEPTVITIWVQSCYKKLLKCDRDKKLTPALELWDCSTKTLRLSVLVRQKLWRATSTADHQMLESG